MSFLVKNSNYNFVKSIKVADSGRIFLLGAANSLVDYPLTSVFNYCIPNAMIADQDKRTARFWSLGEFPQSPANIVAKGLMNILKHASPKFSTGFSFDPATQCTNQMKIIEKNRNGLNRAHPVDPLNSSLFPFRVRCFVSAFTSLGDFGCPRLPLLPLPRRFRVVDSLDDNSGMTELEAGFIFSVFGTACCRSEAERKTSWSSLDEDCSSSEDCATSLASSDLGHITEMSKSQKCFLAGKLRFKMKAHTQR